ncbi:hypothetical protein MXMO3_01775 [Maritalea myrionectae]|uniref:Cache domain-containing protein n=2 Tax=Maritalea myrionectae TaxID=454601 RepID=A0A2R4ME67_9HYPH|nr:hypothetical protein MXMO3_01775 [Maritalea myrionectae]
MRWFLKGLLALTLLAATAPARAQEVSFRARLIDQHLTSIMRGAEIATTAIGETFITSRSNDEEFHAYLNRIKAQLPEARAVLVLGADGMLLHDSFSFPALELDLSQRVYFKEAVARRGARLYVGTAKIGKSSGVPFIPVAKAIYDGPDLVGVVTLIITPARLLQQSRWDDCLYCYVEILRADGQTLTSYPSNAERPEDFLMSLDLQNASVMGFKRMMFHELPTKTSWIKNKDYPLITVYSEIEPH